MTSILSGLESAKQAFAAQQFALSITQRNIANASNESYTRQDAVFADVTATGGVAVSIQTARDKYIDFSISRELQSLGKQQTISNALQQIDAIFNENGGQGLQKALSDFFNSFSSLSANPEDLTLRQQVLSKAAALTTEFHRLYAGAQQVQASADHSVKSTVDEINTITSQIADLNKKISSASGSEEEFSLRDQRQQLLENLSGLIDLSYYEAETGSITVSTLQGGLLVIGKDSFALETEPISGSGFQGVRLNGTDITNTLQSGKIGGLIENRDLIAGYLETLDEMAATIATRVNQQHTAGIDLNSDPGEDLFSFTPATSGSIAGAARYIDVVITDPRKVAAAASTGETGNSENANLLFRIKDEKLFSSAAETTSQFYAGLIYKVGSDEQNAEEEKTTLTNVLERLKNNRDETSGVNLDEEAINLIKYQKAYQASARFATVLESLSDEVLNILGV
jgi:flagellar hook-associated protein 1